MRRSIDFTAALVALILLSPLLLVLAMAVFAGSPGNPFYLAPRMGRNGRRFRMWKFRTMVVGASKIGPPITGQNDKRITWIGSVLRRTKLDELPQFINVLTGDMTLVGPRPEAPELVALYTPEQMRVLDVKPGITGRVQLLSKEESDSIPVGVNADEYYVEHLMPVKVRADLEYLDRRTPFTDFQVLFATALFVLRALVPKQVADRNS